jgi:acyl-lipid omega-6 desaturase (Delta-12 desaturase)
VTLLEDPPAADGPSAGPGDASSGKPTTDRVDKPGSLLPVIRVIPEQAYSNPTWKGLAYFGRDLVLYGLAVWGLIVVDNPLGVVALWVAAGLVISGLFIVGHDAAHGALFKSARLNSWIGHVSMLPSWHVYEGWLLGHNRIHHSYTVREGFDFVWHPYTPQQWADMNWFERLRHRFEWSWAGAGAYYLREVWWHKMIVGKPPARWAKPIRRDRFLVLGFVVVAATLLALLGASAYGTIVGAVWMVAKVLVVPFLAFSFIIGSFVHVHHVAPDIRWWRRREWTKFKGQMEGTTVLRAPKGLNFFIHWIMVHIPHHVDMRIPMYNLELAADAIKAAYPDVVHDEPLRFRDFIHNSRQCKLYDFDAGEWLTYAQGERRLAQEPAAAEFPVSAA